MSLHPDAFQFHRRRLVEPYKRSEFFRFPILPSRQRGSQRRRGRLLLHSFLGETRKEGSRRATPGMFKLLQHFELEKIQGQSQNKVSAQANMSVANVK